MNQIQRTLKILLSVALVVSGTDRVFAYRSDDQPYAFNLPTPINEFQPDYHRRTDLNLRSVFQPVAFNIRPQVVPDLNINAFSMRLPQIEVRDIGDSIWTYHKESSHFDPDLKLYDQYNANIELKLPGSEMSRMVSMELGNMKFNAGSATPKSYTRSYQDEKGNALEIKRFNQTAQANPSMESFRSYIAANPDAATRIPEPTREMMDGYQEKWTTITQDSSGGMEKSNTFVSIDSMKHDSNFHRFVTAYHGTIQDENSRITFDVKSPHDLNGNIRSLEFQIAAKGAPTATITWKPVAAVNSAATFSFLRESLPAPVLVGPRGSFRLNGVDISESPLKITTNGNISPQQVGSTQDLANLMGKENLGISVSFSPPGSDSSKAGFSLGNSLRNLWYMATGRWSEVKGLRQQLTATRDNQPEKFVLAMGFKDPNYMGINDLRNTLVQSKEIILPLTKIQPEASASRAGFLIQAMEVVVKPVTVLFKATVDIVKTGLSIVFGGRIKKEAIRGYDSVTDQDDLKALAVSGQKDMNFFFAQKKSLPDDPPSAVFEIRHNYRTPPLLNILPHSPLIKMMSGEKANNMDVYFDKPIGEFVERLKGSKSIDLFVHGYNVGANKSLGLREDYSFLFGRQGYININGLISWSGDVGNNFLSKSVYFNRAVKSADLSCEGVARMEQFIKSYNPDIKMNAVTHSLGAHVILNAANHGVKFGTVILLVPAVDNEVFSSGGKYEKAIRNIDQLIVVHSKNQGVVFGAYEAARFDRAAGAVGPSRTVDHPNFISIDATKSTSNKWNIEINNHGDIFEPNTINMLIDYLNPKN